MHVHCLQHVPFEDLGSMKPYFIARGHSITTTRLYLDEALPSCRDLDWLIIMGGPMGVNDERQYPWLKREKTFIKSVIASGKVILGICLGAQLIADGLGAKVYKNPCREIGWFPITPSDQVDHTVLKGIFPGEFEAFHWHGDTFAIPESAIPLASSKACRNQGFMADSRIIGLQFHLETTPDSAQDLIDHCRHDLDGSEFVQTEEEMLSDASRFLRVNEVMNAVLRALEMEEIR